MRGVIPGFDFPTAVAAAPGKVWVAEAGFLPGMPPKVKQINLLAQGQVTTLLSATSLPSGDLEGPLTDVTFHDDWLWIAHRQTGANGWLVGAISRFRPNDPVGTFTTLITNLPAAGDHSVDEIVFDPSGRAYFTVGTATNSGVVGPDNELINGWLASAPTFHDFAPVQLMLNGVDFVTPVPFSLDPEADDVTGPYMPFASGAIAPGTTIAAATPASPQQGMIAGNGTVYSFDPEAATPSATLQLEGWGLRNPFGLAFDPLVAGRLFVSNNGCDVRQTMVGGTLTIVGSRPISEDYDDLFTLTTGGSAEFFGWPDFFHDPDSGDVLPVSDPLFCDGSGNGSLPCPEPIFDATFSASLNVEDAFAELEDHSSATKLDISTDARFGFVGDIFQAEAGAFVPGTGATEFTGFRVVRVDRNTGEVHDFVVNQGQTLEEIFNPRNVNKPLDVKFLGTQMLIVDFGVFEPGTMLSQPGTGKVWFLVPAN
jgi:hypothetical protein